MICANVASSLKTEIEINQANAIEPANPAKTFSGNHCKPANSIETIVTSVNRSRSENWAGGSAGSETGGRLRCATPICEKASA